MNKLKHWDSTSAIFVLGTLPVLTASYLRLAPTPPTLAATPPRREMYGTGVGLECRPGPVQGMTYTAEPYTSPPTSAGDPVSLGPGASGAGDVGK